MDWVSLLLVGVLLLLACVLGAKPARPTIRGTQRPVAPPPDGPWRRLHDEAEAKERQAVLDAHERRDDALIERERAAMRARR